MNVKNFITAKTVCPASPYNPPRDNFRDEIFVKFLRVTFGPFSTLPASITGGVTKGRNCCRATRARFCH